MRRTRRYCGRALQLRSNNNLAPTRWMQGFRTCGRTANTLWECGLVAGNVRTRLSLGFPAQTKRVSLSENSSELGCSPKMIRKLDGLTMLLLATVFAAFLLYSCAAKQAPREIKVTVPPDFSGQITLDPCTAGLSARVTLSARGTAPTAACPKPGETVTLTVVKESQNYRIPSNDVTIERAGDGLPVAIKAHIR